MTPLPALRSHTAVVVLAAGASRRLGAPKQLVCTDGVSLLARTVRAAAAVKAGQTLVVLGRPDDDISRQVPPELATVIRNEHPERGLSSSLRCGLSAARDADPALQAVLLTLCDQPHLSAVHLRRLLAALDEGSACIAASAYAGVRGVPAAFAASVFDELAALEGDEGARSVLRRDPSRVCAVEFPAGAVDIDTPHDVQTLHRASAPRS